MRILFLSKRRYMSKDVVLDRYGRFYCIPQSMAAQGHQVHLHTLAYRHIVGARNRQLSHAIETNLFVRDHGLFALISQAYFFRLVADCLRFRPDIVIGASDVPHLVIAYFLSRIMSVPFLADIYDQFMAYRLTRIPLMTRLYKTTLQEADAVACVSRTLAKWVCELGVHAERMDVIGNAVDEIFVNTNDIPSRVLARKEYGLPAEGLLIGTAGALTEDRDISTLYRAHKLLRARGEQVYLVIAGPRNATLPVPKSPNVIDLGELPHDKIPGFFSALDVGVVCNCDSLFARNCFPQKYFEMRALDLPVVAAGVGDIRDYDASDNTWHYIPGDTSSLAFAIERALGDFDSTRTTSIPTWGDQASRMIYLAEKAIELRKH